MARKDLETVTKSELAKLVGTTPQAISNALRRGQIFGDAITEDGKLVLEIARQQFEFNRTERGRKKRSDARPDTPIKKVRDSEDYDWARKQAIAKAKKAEFDALQAELVYRKDAGELIDRQLAVGISYQIAKHLTDSLRNLPDRLAQKTHAAYQAGGNEDDTRETMRLEIDTILHTLSQEVTQFEL